MRRILTHTYTQLVHRGVTYVTIEKRVHNRKPRPSKWQGTFVHDQEVGLSFGVQLADSTQQESRACVLEVYGACGEVASIPKYLTWSPITASSFPPFTSDIS